MALNTTQQAAFNRQISLMKEDGFFLPAQRSLSGNTCYLIVSYGGTGAAALFGVKKQFETVLPKQQLEERVRFLAIDTDKDTKFSSRKIKKPDGTETVEVIDALTNDQFVQLAGDKARLCLNDAKVSEWINPQLKERIIHDSTLLNGDGASGTRQIGRLTLYPPQNVAAITAKIRKLVAELTNNNNHPLRIFILSGIAGGTGSGTVIDLTYLIRSTLESMPGSVDSAQKNVPTRSRYCGFILLPPTGDSDNPDYIARGNRNGYAALKEINYFMNIDARKGKYSLTYGDAQTVTSTKNIFDICYLLDGTADGVAFSNPREKAIHVLSESILDMVCASQTTSTGDKIQTVDSFMNDQSTTRAGMIASKSASTAVRDADYIYCALGHSEFAMPIHEIKAYVAKKMFDQIYNLFQKCRNVEPEDVKELLKNVLRDGAKTNSAAYQALDKELSAIFTNPRGGKGGPYYAINLLRDLVEEVRNQSRKLKIARIGMASDQELAYIEKHALDMNNSCFTVYTAAMDALKDMMDAQFGVVVTAGTTGAGSKTYSFMPQSLGSIEGADYVITYLDGLINRSSLQQLTEAMLQEMIANRQAWTALASTDDPTAAPNAMRRFWNGQLDKIITSTLEDFLIKYYSANPDAYYSVDNHDQTYPFLQTAAENIYAQMLGAGGTAQPMAGFTGKGLQPSDFNAHTFLMVPECAPNLYAELARIAAGAPAGLKVNVCTSMTSDRVSCYKQYTSIPAFKLDWVCAAETNYEQDIRTTAGIGSHMSETAGGNQWKTFPNLLPMSSWNLLPDEDYNNTRERSLAERADHLFDHASALKLTYSMLAVSGVDNLVYTVKVLPKALRPDDALFRDLDRCQEGTDVKRKMLDAINADADKHAAALFAMVTGWETDTQVPTDLENAGVKFETRDLAFSDSILTTGPNDVKTANWDEYMAKCMLRKLPDVMNEVSGTVMVMDKLMERVSRSVQTKKLITLFAQYLVADMFQYSKDAQMWQYTDEDGFPEDLVFIANDMQRLSEYYFMFDAFRNNSEAIINKLTPKLNEIAPVPGCTDMVKKAQAFIAGAQNFKAQLEAWNRQPPIAPYLAVMNSVGYNTNAIRSFYRALYKEFNTMALVGYIPVVTAPPAPMEDLSLEDDFLF